MKQLISGAALVISLLAAGSSAAQVENVERVQQAQVLGSLVSVEHQRDLGLVTISTGCSGALLNRYWVLTADHCLYEQFGFAGGLPSEISPENVRVTAAWTARVGQAVRIVRFGDRGLDVALIQIADHLDYNAIQLLYRDAYDPSHDDLQLAKFGRGMSSFATGEGASAMPGTSDGLYRTFRAEATVSTSSVITIPTNDAGSVGHGGDSGGPDFVMNWGGVYSGIVSVQSSCVSSGYLAGRDETWEWATGILSCNSAPIVSLRDEILEIIREPPPPPALSRVLIGAQDRVTPAPAPSRITASSDLGVARDEPSNANSEFTPGIADTSRQSHTSDEIVMMNGSLQLHHWTLFQGARYSGADLAGAARVPAGVTRILVGDMNGDGEHDIIYWMQSGQISYAPVVRGVVATERINIGGLLPRSSGWHLLGAGDVNGDGTDDLIFRHDGDNKIHYWRIRDGVREDGIDVGGAGYTADTFIGAGDLNGDGTDDLVWHVIFPGYTPPGALPRMENRVRYWPMRNGGRLGTVELGEPPVVLIPRGNNVTEVQGSRHVGVGDINGDGVDDILWQRSNGQVHYWAIRNEAIAGNHDLGRTGPLGQEWRILGVGNVDGN